MAEIDKPPFFTLDGEYLVPAPSARSPWGAGMLHGRLIGGLAARAAETGYAEPGLHPARLTVDMFRNSPLTPLRVESRLVRDGRRIRVVDVEVSGGKGPIGRATVVFLRRGEQPAGQVWAAEPWNVPAPGELGEPHGAGAWGAKFPWDPPFDLWVLNGGGPRPRGRAWIRETHPMVEGEPVSPFVRTALAADFASPLSNGNADNVAFINADYTLALSRLPLGEAIGLESAGHLSEDGVAVGHCSLYDESGPIGHCVVTAIANSVPPA